MVMKGRRFRGTAPVPAWEDSDEHRPTSAPPAILGRRRAGVLAVVLTACTGRGGGHLPPDSPVFTGPASFGFTFSCEDKGGLNPPTGQLRIELSYTDQGSNPLGSPFGIHGIVDTIDPVLESDDLYRSESASRRERADLPGSLPADDIAAGGLPVDVPGA